MSCSCNASALRLFARGLVQVHRLEPAGQASALPLRGGAGPRVLASVGSGAVVATPTTQRQLLHISRTLQNSEDSVAAKTAPEHPREPTEERQANRSSAAEESLGGGNAEPQSSSRFDAKEADTETKKPRAPKKAGKKDFKKQNFDWKAFRSKDPKVRAQADFTNFDWKNWRGKAFSSEYGGINKLLNNLEKAQEQDREAVGVSPLNRDEHRKQPRNKNRAPKSSEPWESERDNDAPFVDRREHWMIQKEAIKAKFPQGWNPRKRLSPDALAGIRALNAQFPDVYTTQTLSEKFEVSPEAIRRILRSRWQPSSSEEEDRYERWHRRGKSVWQHKAAHGIKPPKRWRDEGINVDPEHRERKVWVSRTTEALLLKSREEYMQGFERSARVEEKPEEDNGSSFELSFKMKWGESSDKTKAEEQKSPSENGEIERRKAE